MIDDSVLTLGPSELQSLEKRLFQNEDKVNLILLLDKLSFDAVLSWRQTKGIPEELIVASLDQHLVPGIKKIGRLCIDAVRFRDEATYSEGIERLGRIYNLGKVRELGSPSGSEDPRSLEPSNHSITQLYVVGSYAVFRGRIEYYRTILDLQSVDVENHPVPLLAHPHLLYWRYPDRLPNRFDAAVKLVTEDAHLFSLFFQDRIELITALCQFDFLASFAAWRRLGRAISYFVAYPKSYLDSIIEVLLEPNKAAKILGSINLRQLADFIWSKDSEAQRIPRGGWQARDWSPQVQRFLEQHPRRQ